MQTDALTLSSLPKVELHLHLDCSLSLDVVQQLRPHVTEAEYNQRFIAPEKCTDLATYLAYASNGIALMQTEDELRAVVQDLFAQLQRDSVIYAEIRFAPALHGSKGLSPEQVVGIVTESVKDSINATGIKAGVILCTLRPYSEERSLHTIKLVERTIKHTCVVGFDIAADEAGYPIDAHVRAFEYAVRKDIPRTAHAGEARGADSVWETLTHFRPQRIGHGVRSIEDGRLVEHLAKNDVHLEICPSCNIQTDVFKEYADHPVDFLYDSGVSVGVNTDTRTMTDITLADEYAKLANTFDWDMDHFRQCNLNALAHAFIPEHEKEELRQVLLSG
jgi:adenosine deaminase